MHNLYAIFVNFLEMGKRFFPKMFSDFKSRPGNFLLTYIHAFCERTLIASVNVRGGDACMYVVRLSERTSIEYTSPG